MKYYVPSKEEIELSREWEQHLEKGCPGGYIRSSERFPYGDPCTWFPQLWKWTYSKLGVRSVLDVGCGEGHSTKFFKDLGCDILGIDGSVQAKKDSLVPEFHVVHDFSKGPFIPSKTYDLVWSCEFVEHVEEKYAENFLKTFSYSHKYIMITHAQPGQQGWHHVNCRPKKYWVEKITRLGFKLDTRLTKIARKIAGQGHFLRSGLIFVRRSNFMEELAHVLRLERWLPPLLAMRGHNGRRID